MAILTKSFSKNQLFCRPADDVISHSLNCNANHDCKGMSGIFITDIQHNRN